MEHPYITQERLETTQEIIDPKFEELLVSAYQELNNIKGNVTRVKIPPPQVAFHNRKTIISNISVLAKTLNRDTLHLVKYLDVELSTSSSLRDNGDILQITGRFNDKQIERVIKSYIREYIMCPTCKSLDTNLIRTNRMYSIECKVCGGQNYLK